MDTEQSMLILPKRLDLKFLIRWKEKLQRTFLSRDVFTLGTKNYVKVDGESIQIDPQLLFQRLIVAANATDLKTALSFELCTFAPALFQSTGVLLEATKSTLAESIYTMVQCQQTDIPNNIQYVFDGGDFLHKIPWVKGSTYSEIFKSYRNCP